MIADDWDFDGILLMRLQMIEPDRFYSQVPNVLGVVYPRTLLLQDLESEVGHIEVGTWKIDLD